MHRSERRFTSDADFRIFGTAGRSFLARYRAEAVAEEAAAAHHGAENGRPRVAAACSGADWRATADEGGHYYFAVALRVLAAGLPARKRNSIRFACKTGQPCIECIQLR